MNESAVYYDDGDGGPAIEVYSWSDWSTQSHRYEFEYNVPASRWRVKVSYVVYDASENGKYLHLRWKS